MTVKIKESTINEVRNLIKELTPFSEKDENFDLCEKFALSKIVHHRYLSVNSCQIGQALEGMVLRFQVHGHSSHAQRLEKLVKEFTSSPVFKDHPECDIQWSLLSLLVNLSQSPTASPQILLPSTAEPSQAKTSETFDWATYLREGNEKFLPGIGFDSENESSEWSESESETNEHINQCITPKPPVITKSENMRDIKKEFKECLDKKQWLVENTQHNWWISSYLEQPVTKYNSANVAKLWEEFVRIQPHGLLDTYRLNTISEYKVIREVLFMLCGPTDTRVFYRVDGKFVVRSDVTIPSLTKDAFSNCLQQMCNYFNMLKTLEEFHSELSSLSVGGEDLESEMPPVTYKAYYTSLSKYIKNLRIVAVKIEREVRRQENTHTLMSVIRQLEPYLQDIDMLYLVHIQAVMFSWRIAPNWLCATCLLSVLYKALEDALTRRQATIMLRLFLESLSPYLKIINIWLTEGRLEDFRQEFVVTRSDTDTTLNNWEEGFKVRPYCSGLIDSGVVPSNLLLNIANKMLHVGKTMELLFKLDRITEMKRRMSPHRDLYKEFLESVVKDLPHYDWQEISDEGKHQETIVCPKSLEQTCFQSEFSKQLDDPLLMKAFKKVFAPSQPNKCQERENASSNVCILEIDSIFPAQPLLERHLDRLITDCNSVACTLVCNIFDELQLNTHLLLVRQVMLMEAGDLVHEFNKSIFTQIEQGNLDEYSLSIKIEDCLDKRFHKHNTNFSVVLLDEKDTAEIQASIDRLKITDLSSSVDDAVLVLSLIERIELRYQVDWPLTLLLSAANMKKYNQVFRFLLKVKWALHLLQHLRFTDVSMKSEIFRSKKNVTRLHLLKFWLMNTLCSIHTYLMGQVLHSEGFQMEQNLKQAKDLDELVQIHNHYVRAVHKNCMRPCKSDFIVKGIHQLVTQAYILREMWFSDTTKMAHLDDLEAMYNQSHCLLTVVLRIHVEDGITPQLAGLYLALQDRIPFPGVSCFTFKSCLRTFMFNCMDKGYYRPVISSLVLTDSFEKLPDQIMYPYADPHDLQKHVFSRCHF